MGRLLRQHRMGMEHQTKQDEEAIRRIRRELSHFLLRINECLFGASSCVGKRLECAGSRAHLHYHHVLRWRIGKFQPSKPFSS
jgi:hypothetical protein